MATPNDLRAACPRSRSVPRVTSRRDASTYGSAGSPDQGEREHGLGVRTPMARMATNTAALGQIRLPAVPPASVCCMVRSCDAPHIKKEVILREVDPLLLVRQAFHRAGEPRSGFAGQ